MIRVLILAAIGVLCVAPDISRAAEQDQPPVRKRAEIEAVLAEAPKPDKAPRSLHILLVAGPKDHGKGEHDYPRWQKAWSELLKKAENVTIDTAWKWPTPEQLKSTDLMVCYFKSPWTVEQVADVKALQERGAGIVTIHWAIGADQGWDDHAAVVGLSYRAAGYRHGWVDLKIEAKDHPIVRGFPSTVRFLDEPYWPFIGDASKVKTVATSEELLRKDDGKKTAVPVFWAYEPEGRKGRAFVSIFGHYMWTFDDPYFRLLVLRGMAWAAREPVYRFDGLAVDGVTME